MFCQKHNSIFRFDTYISRSNLYLTRVTMTKEKISYKEKFELNQVCNETKTGSSTMLL